MRALLLLILLAPLQALAAEDTPERAVSALWAALSHAPGASADIVALRRLLHEDAVVFGAQSRDGAPHLRRTLAEDFLAANARVSGKGFHECEVSRSLQVYDRFAVAYSVVESRADKTAAHPDFVGVNSVQLYRDGSQWKLLSLYYHVETQGSPVPLDGGTSGECLGQERVARGINPPDIRRAAVQVQPPSHHPPSGSMP